MAEVSESHIQHNDALKALVAELSAEELRTIIEKMVYDKFIKSIDQEENIAFTTTPKESDATPSEFAEFCLGVGLDDGVDREDVVTYLVDTKLITADQIAKIRVIKRKTFVEVPHAVAQPLINALAGSSLAGRKTRIALVEPQGGEQRFGGSREGGRRDGGRFGGGRSFGRRDGGRRDGGFRSRR